MLESLSLNHPSVSGGPTSPLLPAPGQNQAASWLENCSARANDTFANPTAFLALDPTGDKVSEEEVSPLWRWANGQNSGAVATV